MYNLDVNFLNDRPDLKPGAAGAAARTGGGGRARSGFSSNSESKTPLYAGIATLVGLLGLTAAAFGYFTWHKGNLTDQQAELDTKLGTLEAKRNELTAAKKKVADAEAEIKALASVFSQIKSWTAISQDIRDRLPGEVKILSILQAAPQAGATATGPDAIYTRNLELKGTANSFDEVNNFLVLLQKSKFLNPNATKIASAEQETRKALPALALPVQRQGASNAALTLKFAGKVNFVIQTELTEVPSSELLKELDRKGAIGLVNRFEVLKNKGVKP